MLKYIIKRLLTIFFVLWAVTTLTYFTLHVAPGDTANAIVISLHGEQAVSEETLNSVRTRLDLERSIFTQYFDWIKNILKGNLGTSYKYGKPVSYMLSIRVPNTIRLGFTAFLFSMLVSVPLGVFSALKQNKAFDHVCRGITMLFSSFPAFWIAIMLIILFSIKLKILPVSGMDGLRSIILPALTLSAGMMATVIRMMRTSTLDVLGQDYVLVARSKGLGKSRIVLSHVIRNAIPPIVTVAGLQIGHILGGAVIIERIFAWPGVGGLLIDSINTKDMPMVEGCVLLIACGYALVNLLVDIVYVCIDPRVKYSGGA